jgi:hypothetical protein
MKPNTQETDGLKQKTANAKEWLAVSQRTYQKHNIATRNAIRSHLKKGELLVEPADPDNTSAFIMRYASYRHEDTQVVTLQVRSYLERALPREAVIYLGMCECSQCAEDSEYATFHLLLHSVDGFQQLFCIASTDLMYALKLPLPPTL